MRSFGPMLGWAVLAGCGACHAAPAETVIAKTVAGDQAVPQRTAFAAPMMVETVHAEIVKDAAAGAPVWSTGTEPAATSAQPATGEQTAAASEIMWSSGPRSTTGQTGGSQLTPAAYTQRVNPSNRVIEMEAPVREDKFLLGTVIIRISPLDAVSIQKQRLVDLLKPLLRPEALATLQTIPDTDGFIPLTELAAHGFAIRFDTGQVELLLALAVEQRAVGSLDFGAKKQVLPENLAKPATIASYVNIRTGVDYVSQQFFQDGEISNPRIDFQGATHWHGIALESQATLDENSGFARGGTRFVYDMPVEVLRFTAGDVSPLRTGLQGGSDLLGVTVEKSYQKLRPGFNIHPTGSSSFRVERQSTVEVMNNGIIVQRLSLRPGDYNLSDLPLTMGANEVTLVITDDVGQKRTLHFTMFSGQALLAQGVSEWAFSGGAVSQIGSQEPGLDNFYSKLHYDFNTPAITGYYRRGLLPELTGEAHFQADPYVVMSGASAFFQTKAGYFALGAAGSDLADYGPGFATTASYDLSTSPKDKDSIRRGIRLGADYRSPNFATTGVLIPNNTTALNLAATYYQELPWQVTGSISANYGFGRDDYGNHYGVDLTFARSFGQSLSTGLTLGYDQAAAGSSASIAERDGFRAMLHLAYRQDDKSSIDGSYDTRDGRAQVGYRTQAENGAGGWSAQAEVDRRHSTEGDDDSYGVNGAVNYTGNRLEAGLSHYATMVGIDGNAVDQRTTLTAGTAIAFADGTFAMGRPIGNSFAIVAPHTNLKSSTITIGATSRNAAATDMLGPALVSDLSPYSVAHLPVDASNLPTGYDLGTGAFDVLAPYKSGYRLTVGSDYTVSAIGTLVNEQNEPVALLTGDAYEEGQPEGRHVQIFTNRAGRFGAQGLRPGRWVVDMATDPKCRYIIDVPQGTAGMLQVDILKPVKSDG